MADSLLSSIKYVKVNVHNTPLNILQTCYYAYSAEQNGNVLSVDIRLEDPSPISLEDAISAKLDLSPLRRPLNVKVFCADDEVETELNDSVEDVFNPINSDCGETQVSNSTLSTLTVEEVDPPIETTSVRRKRKQKNKDVIWIQKRRKSRSDKGKPRGIECPLCLNHREILHICQVCNHGYCKMCFDQLLSHDYQIEICNICKRLF